MSIKIKRAKEGIIEVDNINGKKVQLKYTPGDTIGTADLAALYEQFLELELILEPVNSNDDSTNSLRVMLKAMKALKPWQLEVKESINELFGAGTYNKLFGETNNLEVQGLFLNDLTDALNKLHAEHEALVKAEQAGKLQGFKKGSGVL